MEPTIVCVACFASEAKVSTCIDYVSDVVVVTAKSALVRKVSYFCFEKVSHTSFHREDIEMHDGDL